MTRPTRERLDIPKTGRIGRFSKIVEGKTTQESFLKIMKDSDVYNQFKPEKKAEWWQQAVEKLQNEVGTKMAVDIMRSCGSMCCGQGNRKTAKRLMGESDSIEDFLDKISKYEVKEGELEYKLVGRDIIIGKHNRCFCGQVKKTKNLFVNNIYCQCSVEFNRQFFSAAFGRPVEVELKQSIISGGDCCEFVIKIADK